MRVTIVSVTKDGPVVDGEFHLSKDGRGIDIVAPEENQVWMAGMFEDQGFKTDPAEDPAGWLRELAEEYANGSSMYAVLDTGIPESKEE